jgi:CheY-like chemotaxis protein
MLDHEIVMEKSPQTIPTSCKSRRILVADDERAIQLLLSQALSYMGYDVTLAGNGLEALTQFQGSSFDLVLTDWHMPLMDGGRLSRFVKEQSPSTPVIMMTGGTGRSQDWEDLNTNFIDSILLKPFRLEELEDTIRKMLGNL